MRLRSGEMAIGSKSPKRFAVAAAEIGSAASRAMDGCELPGCEVANNAAPRTTAHKGNPRTYNVLRLRPLAAGARRSRFKDRPMPTTTEKKTPITVAYGDGIGPEIMDATLRMIDAAGAQLEIENIEIGESVYNRGLSNGIEDTS